MSCEPSAIFRDAGKSMLFFPYKKEPEALCADSGDMLGEPVVDVPIIDGSIVTPEICANCEHTCNSAMQICHDNNVGTKSIYTKGLRIHLLPEEVAERMIEGSVHPNVGLSDKVKERMVHINSSAKDLSTKDISLAKRYLASRFRTRGDSSEPEGSSIQHELMGILEHEGASTNLMKIIKGQQKIDDWAVNY